MLFSTRSSLLSVLLCLTVLSLSAQFSLFAVHSHAAELVDALIGSSIPTNILHSVVLLPIIEFILIQISAYLIFVGFLWFITVSCSEFFQLSSYGLGIFLWFIYSFAIFMLNAHYFPASFFAQWIQELPYQALLLWLSVLICSSFTLIAYYQLFWQIRRKSVSTSLALRGPRLILGLSFLISAILVLIIGGVNHFLARPVYRSTGTNSRPNIILIGLDSVRPDFVGYFGNSSIHTPNIDQFLKAGLVFRDSYTPLARTFPAWVSILTGKHPRNSHARINLAYPEAVIANDTLAKRLKAAGYETIYATDEKRFSNITTEYGFDRLIGPSMGLNDFILGGLSDFPLTNLMINLPLGRFLFPYHYANRAAAITYEPNNFLLLVKQGLRQRRDKPLFLALHFCLSHWPFTWADDQQPAQFTMNQRYQSSVEELDKQVGKLIQILKENGLLEHSLIVLLSDHGTSFGLPGDRFIDQQHYQGNTARLKWLPLNKLSNFAHSEMSLEGAYSLNTAYGQGTEVLSLKQYQVLLAFKYFGGDFSPHSVSYRSSLLDITPSILAFLHLPPIENSDGLGLNLNYYFNGIKPPPLKIQRALYLETGYSLSELETDQIKIEKVVGRSINLYQLNPKNGHLFIRPTAEASVLEAKQRAVLMGSWILARYPLSQRIKLMRSGSSMQGFTYVLPAYYVLANIRTGQWTIGFDSALAKRAPLLELRKRFNAFYGAEL